MKHSATYPNIKARDTGTTPYTLRKAIASAPAMATEHSQGIASSCFTAHVVYITTIRCLIALLMTVRAKMGHSPQYDTISVSLVSLVMVNT
jgi:hypothetical protein